MKTSKPIKANHSQQRMKMDNKQMTDQFIKTTKCKHLYTEMPTFTKERRN